MADVPDLWAILPRRGDDQFGECWITRINDPIEGTQLRVERADPVVRISPELLAELPPPGKDWPASFDGKVLRIQGVNRTVVYRIRDVLEPRPGAPGCWDYVGEWPD
jgi:hypothetical protein